MATTITLALGGDVNGVPVDLSGQAELDLVAGLLELELVARASSRTAAIDLGRATLDGSVVSFLLC